MSQINCEACDELRNTSAEYVQNGVSDTICASLQNDTGLNPSLSSLHDDATDMHNINDCTIGRMAQELQAYDVCDWKEFMAKFLPNLYEFNKAVNCVDAGQWQSIHSVEDTQDLLCKSMDNVLGLIQGTGIKSHAGTWFDSFLDKITITVGGTTEEWDKTTYHPSLDADILDGAGCTQSKRLGRWLLNTYWDSRPYPRSLQITLNQPLSVDEPIGIIPRSAVPASDMPDWKWTDLCVGTGQFQWYVINGDTAWYIGGAGYTIVDGIEVNKWLESYGYENLVLFPSSFIGSSRQGRLRAFRSVETVSYNV